MSSNLQTLCAATAVTGLIVLPSFVSDPYLLHLLILSLIFSIFGASWNFVTGFAGLKTFGHQAFFGIGAYGSALASMKLGISPWISIWAGAALATMAGLLVALPALRIRSVPHVAIMTLAFAEIVRMVLANAKNLTRGELGLVGIPTFEAIEFGPLGAIAFNPADKAGYYYLALALAGTSLTFLYVLTRSKTGLALVAIRDSQDAAESLGVNLTLYKMIAFGVSAALVALAGAFYAHYILVLTPSAAAGMDLMMGILAIVLIGGVGSFFGPIVAAFALTIGLESMRGLGEYRMLIYGAMIVCVVMFCPRGIASLVGGSRVLGSSEPAVPTGEPLKARGAR
jgi:branched-chain amino acid transport system permease protein